MTSQTATLATVHVTDVVTATDELRPDAAVEGVTPMKTVGRVEVRN